MNMDLTQTKLIGLTLELEIKAKEYKDLCQQLEDLKSEGISPNDPKLLILKTKFENNQKENVIWMIFKKISYKKTSSCS